MNVGNVSESRISAGNEFHNLAPSYQKLFLRFSVFGKGSCSEVEEPLRSYSVMLLLRTKRVASELGAKSFRTLYICLTLDLARRYCFYTRCIVPQIHYYSCSSILIILIPPQ